MTALHRRTRSWAAAALAATIWLMVSAGPAWADAATPVNPEATNSTAIDQIYRATLGVCVTIFVLVGGWLLYTAIRFRARRGQPAPEPPQFHGSTRLEIGWTVVPVLILAALAGYTLAKIPRAENIGGRGELKISVLAQQFSFSYTYPNGKHPRDPATLVVPVDTPIVIDLRSKDVAHDFWVPALGPKVDAIPGQLNRTGFTATALGIYQGGCAELCGIGHATMLITVKVISKPAFRNYMAGLS
ncbi:MAG: cytochrome c oxidase subunit II [Gaiellales bacterium]